MAELPSTVVSLISLLQKCRSSKNLASAKDLHAHIRKNGMESHIAIGNHMVPMFVECGGLYEAQQVFDRLAYRNEHSWTSLMSGYIDSGEAHHAINLYRKMQEDFVQPSSYTYMAAMKACAGLKNLERGQEIHMDVARKGSERHIFVGNSLVDMYAKCGLLEEALEVLEKMPVQNVVTWTTLIAGYVEHGRGQEAVRCFEDMQEEHVCPNAVTFVCILKACASTGVIDKGLEIHADIVHKGFEEDLFVGNTLVDMYAKCGSLPSAQEVFDKLPIRDSVSWNALIAGYAEHEPGEYTLKTFEQMQMGGVPPDTVTFICALKVCGNLRTIVKGQEIHTDILGKGFERDIFVGNALVDMYAKSGLLIEAQDALDKLPFRDVISWNALIAGYAEKAFGEKALKCFERMQAEGITPDSVTFVSTIKACGGTVGAIGRGLGIHKGITQLGYERDVIVGSALVDMYARSGSLIEAREVFDKLPVRHVMLWTALIAGYAEHGLCEEALTCYEKMQIEGVPPDTVTFVCLLKACGSIGALYKGHQMHIDLAQKGFETDLLVGSSLVDMYAKLGSLLEACKVFENLPMQDAVLWSAMIRGYGMNHEGGMAIKCFESMQEQGVKPDDVTFMCVLSACSHARLVFKGQEFFNVMREEYGFVPTVNHYTCMVDLLAKSGHLHEAEKFLEAMSCPPLWTALLTACKVHGEADLGLRCFQQLVQLDPECSAPYVLMSNVYAATGQWSDAYRIEEMRKHEGLSKKPATALIEVNKKVHQFVVGENQSKEISAILESMISRMKVKGHVPNVSLVL